MSCVRYSYRQLYCCAWQQDNRSIHHSGRMKRTGNQKVVTAAIQNRPGKALSAPYPACTGIPNRKCHLCRYKRKWGLVACCCWYSGKQKSRPCQHSDFKSGYCRRRLSSNFRVGLIRSPFAHSKSGKPHIFPGKSGLCLSGFKFAPGKFRVLAGRFRSARLHFKSNLKRTKFVV